MEDRLLDLSGVRQEFLDRVEVATRLFDAHHDDAKRPNEDALGRDVRGLVVVLLFASYENLLRQLSRQLIETALSLRVGNRRLQPGFQALAVSASAQSVRDSPRDKLFSRAIPKFVEVAASGSCNSLNASTFPDDGSYMRPSQLTLFCTIFGLPNPEGLLPRVWPALNAIVGDRNRIAHGQERPGEVGRRRSPSDVRALIQYWREDWLAFLDAVETAGSSRSFYRKPR